MMNTNRIAYVVKKYPRYSETFIVNEILAHEAAGATIEIFSLFPPCDTHFQNSIASVRAPVSYLTAKGIDAIDFWNAVRDAGKVIPDIEARLQIAAEEDGRTVYQALLLAQQVRRKEIDHIHAHFATQTASVARLAAHFSDVPFTFTAHAKDIFHNDVSHQDLERKLRDASAVVTVSEFNVDYLRERFGEAAQNVCRIYNGLDLDLFPYEIPDERPEEIIAVGRLVEKKGVRYLIDACRVLKENRRRFHCSVIGSGELQEQLQSQIESSGLAGFVQLCGPLPQPEVIRRVQNAAVMVAPCIIGEDGDRDGLPTVLLEAMALGTPCISTDVTGIPEILKDQGTGLLVPQKDVHNLAKKIDELFQNPELRVRLSMNARRLVEKHFDIRENTAALRDLFAASADVGFCGVMVR